MELSSTLTLEMLGEPFLLEKRIRLLHAIEEYGSISKAAKAVPMSYKSAWEAVDTMNNLASEAIVIRETGGRNGGGTQITPYGKRLLESYAILKEEHSRFLQRLSALQPLENAALATIGRLSLQISARNQIGGKIVALACGSVHAEVTLTLKNGMSLHSVITKEAAENLALGHGDEVVAIFKSSSVSLRDNIRAEGDRENTLPGRVSKIICGEKSREVIVDIGGGDTIVSVIPHQKEEQKIEEGNLVSVVIDKHDVMIGK